MTAGDESTAEWTLMFTDIEGSTERGTQAQPAEYTRVVEEHKARLRRCFSVHQGIEDLNPGDGFMVAFRNPSDAIACAVAIQEDLRLDGAAPIQTESGGKPWTIQVRIGVYKAAGEVSRNADGTFTDTEVNLASRFAACAVGGQIVVNPRAYNAIKRHSLSYEWKVWSNRFIRDFSGPQDLHELMWDGASRDMKASLWAPEWLPRETNAFVGRQDELNAIKQWLDGISPLLVLHGEGGVGKTRIVSQAVRTLGAAFEGRIYGVALDREFSGNPDEVTPSHLAARIGEALEAPQDVLNSEGAKALVAYIKRRFNGKTCWLILDNFESVNNEQTLELIGELLYGVPGLRCVLTCREQVDLNGVSVAVHVEGMAVPPTHETHIESYDGYTLFRVRAQQVKLDVDLSDTTSLIRILLATEGNSLAIELISAHCKNLRLTLRDIADGLEASRLKWLCPPLGSTRYGEPRHKSLEACIDWSFQLLPSSEQELYPRLSVFPADFDVQAAESISVISTEIIDHWIAFHLVQVEDVSKRCVLQPVLREFAAARLQPDILARLRSAFAFHYGAVAVLNKNLNDAVQRTVLRQELRNLHAAAECLCTLGMLTTFAALLLGELGNRLMNMPIGTLSENLLCAIACFETVTRVFTEAEFPQHWAGGQLSLGYAYFLFSNTNRTANVQRAIIYYEAALRVFTESAFPIEWAKTQDNLGVAYKYLPIGDQVANLQHAIDCHIAALRVRTQANFPQDWAGTQNNLGEAYRSLPSGDRNANVQCAIACYESALCVFTEAASPMDWAMPQNNLGIAYAELLTGDREVNLQRAIEHSQAALRVYTKAEFPLRWAGTQTNLGSVYSQLHTGDCSVNLQNAIRCFTDALSVYTEAEFPLGWAQAQGNLGTAYQVHSTNDNANNLLQSIACYTAALRVYTEADFPEKWAMIQYNLATVHAKLKDGNSARQAMQNAVRGYRAVGMERMAQEAETYLHRRDWP